MNTHLSFDERLSLLLEHEITYRKNRRLQRLQRQAKLRQNACIEEIDTHHPRQLSRDLVTQLYAQQWLHDKQNLIITGPTGIGKSWLACALGQLACRHGLTTRYVRLSRLLGELRIAHADGSYHKLMTTLAKTQLLILDDWGIDTLNRQQRNDLLEILEDRHQLHSTLITSQLPTDQWHNFIGDATTGIVTIRVKMTDEGISKDHIFNIIQRVIRSSLRSFSLIEKYHFIQLDRQLSVLTQRQNS